MFLLQDKYIIGHITFLQLVSWTVIKKDTINLQVQQKRRQNSEMVEYKKNVYIKGSTVNSASKYM